MDANFINSFLESGYYVIKQMTQLQQMEKGDIDIEPLKNTKDEINVLFKITGAVEGVAIYACDTTTAINFVRDIIGEEIEEFSKYAEDAISELGNVITGRASILLDDQGYFCHLSPPQLIKGINQPISATPINIINIPIITEYGTLFVKVGLSKH